MVETELNSAAMR